MPRVPGALPHREAAFQPRVPKSRSSSARRSPDIERSLELRPDGDPFEVWLFDDAALTLFDRGRARSPARQGKHAELTVKIANPGLRAGSTPKWCRPKPAKCEIDCTARAWQGRFRCRATSRHKERTDLVAGRAAAADLLSAVQVAYLRDVA